MTIELNLQQQVLLLALRDDKGTFSSGTFIYSVAGAMISELLLMERIRVGFGDDKPVKVIDDSATGDELLDELLSEIKSAEEQKPFALEDWVYWATKIPDLEHRIATQLCELGILKHDEKKTLWLFTRQVYPELDGTAEDDVRAKMARVMFDEKVEPDAKTAALISLSSHSGLLGANFAKEELRQHKARIKKIASGDILAAGATKTAIVTMQTAVYMAAMIPVFVTTTISH